MLSINTNLSSLITQSSLKTSTLGLNQAIERMTTGFKINHAKDNAAGYSISTNMSTKISAYQVAEDNAAMGLDMVTTASESLSLISNGLQRLRALQEQASNGTYGAKSLDAINAEANAIVDEIERAYNTTEYNGISLLGEKIQTGFIESVNKQTPDIVVSDPTKLAEAIANNNVIGISNAETLAQLATLVNSGTTCAGKTIVLTNDIDVGDWCAEHLDENGEGGWTPIGNSGNAFKGTFDGNGYEISNIYINRPTTSHQGLFGYTYGATIQNVGVVNSDITGKTHTGALVASNSSSSTISNCYSAGDVIGYGQYTGGLVGFNINSSSITNCYSTGDVIGYGARTGGLVGENRSSFITNCYSTGSVVGYGQFTGGLVGLNSSESNSSITGCYATSKVEGTTSVGAFVGSNADNSTISDSIYYSSINGSLAGVGSSSTTITSDMLEDKGSPTQGPQVNLQVGINSGENSSIGIVTSLVLKNIENLRGIGSNTRKDYLSQIDEILATVSAKQTEYGAAQNRLQSALEEISINYENLISSRSTIRDADIAEESSSYIKMQILQQASATLMATANQSPSIAFQLI